MTDIIWPRRFAQIFLVSLCSTMRKTQFLCLVRGSIYESTNLSIMNALLFQDPESYLISNIQHTSLRGNVMISVVALSMYTQKHNCHHYLLQKSPSPRPAQALNARLVLSAWPVQTLDVFMAAPTTPLYHLHKIFSLIIKSHHRFSQ